MPGVLKAAPQAAPRPRRQRRRSALGGPRGARRATAVRVTRSTGLIRYADRPAVQARSRARSNWPLPRIRHADQRHTGEATGWINVCHQTGEDDDHLAVDDSERRKELAGLRSGDGPLSVRARPSSIKRDCDRRTMRIGRTCLADVHAKSRLILETSAGTPVRRRGPGGACPDRTRAIPCKVSRGQSGYQDSS
jgi:hypothetical protein